MASYQMQAWLFFSWWFVCHTCHYKIETADSALTHQLAVLCGWVPGDSAESPNIPGRGLEESAAPWPQWVLGSQCSLPQPTWSSHSNFTCAVLPCGSGAFPMNLWSWKRRQYLYSSFCFCWLLQMWQDTEHNEQADMDAHCLSKEAWGYTVLASSWQWNRALIFSNLCASTEPPLGLTRWLECYLNTGSARCLWWHKSWDIFKPLCVTLEGL